MRPAAWIAVVLTTALLVACPWLVGAALAAVAWLLVTPPALVVALAVTVAWMLLGRPVRYGPRWA